MRPLDELVVVPLPEDAGVEHAPGDPSRWRLVLSGADLLRLDVEVDLARHDLERRLTPNPTAPASPAAGADAGLDDLLTVLRECGISQPEALRHVRDTARGRGEEPPSSLRHACRRPSAVRDLHRLIADARRSSAEEASPW